MAEFEEKLNALLSNPESMAQVMQMAQNLMGGQTTAPAQPAGPPPSAPSYPPSYSPPQPNSAPPPGNMAHPAGGMPFGGTPSGGGPDLFSSLGSLLGGMDPKMLTRLLPLVQEFSQGTNTQSVQLLQALRPFLKAERQEKVDRALQLARMIHIAKKFFAGWEV